MKSCSRKGNKEPDPVSWSKDFLPRSTSYNSFLLFNRSDDLGEFGLGVWIVLGGLSDPSEVLEREFILVLGSEPSRAFLHEWDDTGHDSDWNQLETDGDSPLDISSCWVDECYSVGDPV
jgi:hypothetical protein